MSFTPIEGFPGYSITNDGRVFSGWNWRGYGFRELQQTPNADGYPSVRLVSNGVRRRMAVHRLVASTFIGAKPTSDSEVRHINGDKTDNRVENLAWGTAAENAADRERHGRTSRGERHGEAIKAGWQRSRQGLAT